MTTFEDAARAEAESLFLYSAEVPSPQELGVRMALWARDHLAEQEAAGTEVEAAMRAFRDHLVEWFPPEPPSSRVPTLLCMECGWQHELDGYADESDAGLAHRMDAALRAAARARRGHA